MPRLIIDDQVIEVPAGTKVIDAAEMLGIMIPRFCYHEALGSVGACRMCAVKFLEGPVKGIQMSCMVDAQDGMVVSTSDEEAVAFRKFIIECLMLNHPHDCPVCDEGGQCFLQDETVSGGHGIRRYLGKKRTYRDQYLGPFVAHEMNRCIHCYRCARFYQEYTGFRDLGVMQIGSRVFFGRHSDGALESPFAGNLVDLCPTGVYTDKAARYRARHWDLERAPSLCIHCSLGCSTVANARYREVLRVEARCNPAVNGHFICDRGRFGYGYSSHPKRPRQARISGKGLPTEQVVAKAAGQLNRVMEIYGPLAIAAVGSGRASLETLAALKSLCEVWGWRGPHFFTEEEQGTKTCRAVARLDPRLAVSLKDIESADFILAAGLDALQEAPMLAVAMRQSFRKGAVIGVIDPRPVSLPFMFHHIPAPPWQMEQVLRSAAGEGIPSSVQDLPDSPFREWDKDLAFLKEELRKSRRPIVVCSTSVISPTTPDTAADIALHLRDGGKDAGLFYVLPGPNSYGAARFSSGRTASFAETLEAIEHGSVKALVVAETDLFREFPDRRRLYSVLDKLELLLVMDCLPTETVWRAHTFLPTTTIFECEASFANQEGRIQRAFAVHAPGVPVWQETGRSHPVRAFRDQIPGGSALPAWKLLSNLYREMDPAGEPMMEPRRLLEAGFPELAGSSEEEIDTVGWRVAPESRAASIEKAAGMAPDNPTDAWAPAPGQFLLLLVDTTFGTEELSGYSTFLRKVEREPRMWMHSADAAEMGFSEGEALHISTKEGPVRITLTLSQKMGRNILILPRHMQLEWQRFKGSRRLISRSDLSRAV